jgi:hypothetical protein
MKDNLDELKTIQKDELKEELKNAWTKQIKIWKKIKLLDELKELNENKE